VNGAVHEGDRGVVADPDEAGSRGSLDEDLADLEARVCRLEQAVRDLHEAAEAPAPRRREVYDSLDAWVSGYFVVVAARQHGVPGARWCPRWAEHPPAVERLRALWRAWEALHHDPGTGMGTFLRDHLDHSLPLLLADHGPFAGCNTDRHTVTPPLPVVSGSGPAAAVA
jgi:Domain of unknown function (DUF4913)